MNDMAKVIRTGSGQSVELPEGYRFDADEVRIHREGERIVLEPADSAIDPETGLTIARLRELIQEGIDSGPPEPWDADEIKRLGRERLARER